MSNLTRGGFIRIGSVAGAALAGGADDMLLGIQDAAAADGGGQKVYGVAVQYDKDIDPASLALDTFTAGVVPAAKGFFPGMPQAPDKNSTTARAEARRVAALYTNAAPALRADHQNVTGSYVIAEFEHQPDLSLPSTDSGKVSLRQHKTKPCRRTGGTLATPIRKTDVTRF